MRIQAISPTKKNFLKNNVKSSNNYKNILLKNSKCISFGNKSDDNQSYADTIVKTILGNKVYREALNAYLKKGHTLKEALSFDEETGHLKFMKDCCFEQKHVQKIDDSIPNFLKDPLYSKPHKPALGYNTGNIFDIEDSIDFDALDDDIIAGLFFNPFEDPSDFDNFDF